MRVLDMLGGFPGSASAGMHVIRLHLALRKAGLDARILYRERRLRGLPPAGSGMGLMDAASAHGFRSHPFYRDAEILHFHCLPGDALSYLLLPVLARDKAAVLTIHDPRAFIGRCADCPRRKGGACPPPGSFDAACESSRFQWLFRSRPRRRAPLFLVSTSRWMSSLLPEGVLSRFPVYEIPHGVNVNLFQPLEKEACRVRLDLPRRQKTLLACPDDAVQAESLLAALAGLPAALKAEILLLTLGADLRAAAGRAGVRSLCLGPLGEDYPRAIALSAADVFIALPRTEAGGLRVLESMACGTPVVAADGGEAAALLGAGGVLSEAGHADALRETLARLLRDDGWRRSISEESRAVVLQKHTLSLQSARYRALFVALRAAAGRTAETMPPRLPSRDTFPFPVREHD